MRSAWIAGLSMLGSAAFAQDTRTVTEPVIPPVCTRLDAQLTVAADLNGGHVRDEDEARLDTTRIQQAMDGCKSGQAVELARHGAANGFLTGPLDLRSGVTLLIDKDVTLYGSRDPKVYEVKLPDAAADAPLKCGTSIPRPGRFGQEAGMAQVAGLRRGGCRPLISAANVTNAAIMGEGTLDGRGYAKLMGHDYSWWEMARKAEPKDDIYFSTRLLVANHADGLVLYKVTLHNSPNFHVSVNGTNGFTAWGVHLLTPVNRTLDARNTDGIDPGTSSNVTVAHSWIDNGDDNIAVKSGTTHMSVLDNHFYTGHGMSIGSETVGQAYLLVDGLTEDHTSSGVRIKSNVTRGGAIHDLVYTNICMRNVANPIAISPYYTNQTTEGFVDPGYTGTKIPDYKGIVLDRVYSTTPGNVLIAGLNDEHRTEISLQEVMIEGIRRDQVHLAYDDIHVGTAGTNLPLTGVATVKTTVAHGDALILDSEPCRNVFVPMR